MSNHHRTKKLIISLSGVVILLLVGAGLLIAYKTGSPNPFIRLKALALNATKGFKASDSEHAGHEGHDGHEGMASGKVPVGKEYYTCAMHPQIIRDQPGECPICGMTLIKKTRGEESAEEAAGVVTISPEMVQILGVTTEKVQPRRIVKQIRAVGRIDYDERLLKVVTAHIPGRIDKLFVDFTGMKVKQGDPLVWIYSPELVSTQQEFLLSLETFDKMKNSSLPEIIANAQSLVESSKRRLDLWGITEQQIQELEKSRKVNTHLTIYAPISGTVIQKGVIEGTHVAEGSPLYQIADLSSVWMYADIYEYEMSWVKVGQDVKVTVAAYPEMGFTAVVSFIDPVLNPNTRTVRVRTEIKNPDSTHLLKPGMFANAFLQVTLGEAVLAVSEDAVIHSGERNLVLLSKDGGKFQPVEVTLGTLAEGYYQVLGGLSGGETVVTSANFLIDSESQLKAAVSRMAEKEGATLPAPAEGGKEKPPAAGGHAGHGL
ncbi:efflux RND transporter periplasmic adaptor subunit [Candidatus Poribacteria bacterium]|nr:efflux RND transporter periplasmic adaptor subunit [Candidatus Poribacteria bacterium]